MEVSNDDIAKSFGGSFLDYCIRSLEEYKFHYTAHRQWDEMVRLARLGAALETLKDVRLDTITCNGKKYYSVAAWGKDACGTDYVNAIIDDSESLADALQAANTYWNKS